MSLKVGELAATMSLDAKAFDAGLETAKRRAKREGAAIAKSLGEDVANAIGAVDMSAATRQIIKGWTNAEKESQRVVNQMAAGAKVVSSLKPGQLLDPENLAALRTEMKSVSTAASRMRAELINVVPVSAKYAT